MRKRKFNDIMGSFDKIALLMSVIMISGLAILMAFGASKKILDEDFIKYFITISFVMAGFTFNIFFQKEKSHFGNIVLSSCYAFILASFFLLSSFIVHIPPFGDVFNKALGIFGIAMFFAGFLVLVLGVYFEVNPPRK